MTAIQKHSWPEWPVNEDCFCTLWVEDPDDPGELIQVLMGSEGELFLSADTTGDAERVQWNVEHALSCEEGECEVYVEDAGFERHSRHFKTQIIS
jgi:hypothetical protein